MTLRRIREARGLSRCDLAKLCNLSEATIKRAERDGLRRMSWPSARRLAAALGVDPLELLVP